MTTGHEYYGSSAQASERLESYIADAARYRETDYGRLQSRSGAFAAWLGTRLLEWGRRLRERSGDVVVEIALRRPGARRSAA